MGGIIKKIRDTVGNRPVYLSIDVSPNYREFKLVSRLMSI